MLELTTGGQHYDYLYDGKGNVSAVIDSNQNVVASYKYDGFGKLLSKTGTLDQPYQFSTKYYYTGMGLNYYGYRLYNSLIGKWMTRDPMGEKADINLYRAMDSVGKPSASQTNLYNFVDSVGKPFAPQTNLYQYAGNSPINYIDPLGLKFSWGAGGAAGIWAIDWDSSNPLEQGFSYVLPQFGGGFNFTYTREPSKNKTSCSDEPPLEEKPLIYSVGLW